MEFLIKLLNSITGGSTSSKNSNVEASTPAKPLFKGPKKTSASSELQMVSDVSDEQIRFNNVRKKYIQEVKNPDHKVKSGENAEKIALKYGIETASLLAHNGLDKTSVIKVGQVLKVPNTRKIVNVRNLNDVAGAMGVSSEFIKNLKRAEDDANLADNKFHNTPYKDKAGVLTIGIGHVVKKGDKTKLTDAEVCELCAKDLMRMEDNLSVLLGGRKVYEKLPQAIKEALLDMTFNKGTKIIEETPGLLYCLKAGKYEAAINKFTYNKSTTTQKEMSGLSKRRLFDISTAAKMYKDKVPQSNINTAQQVYNRGIELLRAECKKDGLNFENQVAGYNKDVQSYFGNRIKLKLITK
ncbi:LysM peptidoglycan-binding domain-containing protein [bacterium]|nr:LysM peptidoglycan-binding domain-containing protein [bacterium]